MIKVLCTVNNFLGNRNAGVILVNRKRVAHVRLAFGLRDLSVIAP